MAAKKNSSAKESKTPAKVPATKSRTPAKRTQRPIEESKAPATKAKQTRTAPAEKPKKGRGHTRPTAAEKALILERRLLVYELKKAGNTFRQIVDHLKTKDQFKRGISLATIHSDFHEELQAKRDELDDTVETYRQMALDECNDLRRAVIPRARREGLKEDIDSILNIQKREDTILQYSKGQQSDEKMKDALTKFLGFDPEAELSDETNDKGV